MADLNSISGIHYEMMRRCYNDKSVAYKDYGEKGIEVCTEWHDQESFKVWARENGYEKGLRLERISSSGNYEPNNCRFGCKYKDKGINKQIRERVTSAKKKKSDVGITGQIRKDELYATFRGMHNRCEQRSHTSYMNYGGRGIKVCDEWSGKDGFFNFKKWAIDNGWTKGLSLDRKDNNKNYEAENCRFVARSEQNYNRRSNILYKYGESEMPLGTIAKLENVKYGMLYDRVRLKGMTVQQALSDIKSTN